MRVIGRTLKFNIIELKLENNTTKNTSNKKEF